MDVPFLLAGPQESQIAPVLESFRILGVKVVNVEDFLLLILRFFLNLTVIGFIVRGVYYKRARRPDYAFTYMLISTAVFLLCFLLEGVKLELGFALGLFAIFGIIRYRTDAIPIKEMTYLFVIIGVAVMNALSNKKVSYAELVFSNLAVIFILVFFERVWFPRQNAVRSILYERVELTRPDCHTELLSDLRERTGLDVVGVQVNAVSFLRDTAELLVFYRSSDHPRYVAPPAPSDKSRGAPPRTAAPALKEDES